MFSNDFYWYKCTSKPTNADNCTKLSSNIHDPSRKDFFSWVGSATSRSNSCKVQDQGPAGNAQRNDFKPLVYEISDCETAKLQNTCFEDRAFVWFFWSGSAWWSGLIVFSAKHWTKIQTNAEQNKTIRTWKQEPHDVEIPDEATSVVSRPGVAHDMNKITLYNGRNLLNIGKLFGLAAGHLHVWKRWRTCWMILLWKNSFSNSKKSTLCWTWTMAEEAAHAILQGGLVWTPLCQCIWRRRGWIIMQKKRRKVKACGWTFLPGGTSLIKDFHSLKLIFNQTRW